MSNNGPFAAGASQNASEAPSVNVEVRPLPRPGADCRPANGKNLSQQQPGLPNLMSLTRATSTAQDCNKVALHAKGSMHASV